MKRKALASTLILASLFSAMAGILNVNLAQANPIVVPIDDLSLQSPRNTNYKQNFVQVSCSYSILDEPVNDHSSMQTSVSYVLDGLERVSVSNYKISSNKLPNSISYSVSFQIRDLANGSHTLSVRISATADKGFTTFAASSEVVTFTINANPSSINPTPSPTPLPSPSPSPAPSNEPTSTPTTEPRQSELFPTTLVIATVVTVTVFGFGFLLNLAKKKRSGKR